MTDKKDVGVFTVRTAGASYDYPADSCIAIALAELYPEEMRSWPRSLAPPGCYPTHMGWTYDQLVRAERKCFGWVKSPNPWTIGSAPKNVWIRQPDGTFVKDAHCIN